MEQRVIKFRAWDTISERMVDEPYNFRASYPIDKISDDKKDYDTPFQYYETWQDVDDGVCRPCFIMQFTGLHDKNGKEIYEGDIIKKEFGHWGVIVYKSPSFEVTVSETQSSLYTKEWIKDSVVIGNIYQNPELIKQ